MSEPNVSGIPVAGAPGGNSRGAPRWPKMAGGGASMDVPHVKELSDAITMLNGTITSLQANVNKFSGKHMVDEYNKIATAAQKAGAANGGATLGGSRASTRSPAPSTPFGGNNNPMTRATAPAPISAGPTPMRAPTSSAPAGGGGGFGGGGGGMLGGMGTAFSAAGGGSPGLVAAGISGVMGGISKGLDLLGAIASAGVQFTANRIDGPTGNRNAMLGLSQSLAPISTTTGLTMNDLVKGLAQKTPVQGSLSDISSTILAGNAVGAQVKGTPGRNGFFEGVREMQTLTPGVGAGQLAGTMANYMGNTSSQQMGAFYGGGAFTMMGAGGRYKSLGEWASGITEFFKQQRPGQDRGKEFSKADLMAQNFPGSNVNAWFQMMGVPQNMVDYWWQYVLTKAASGSSDKGPFDLAGAVRNQRGIDLGQQRLGTVTQASRRDFMMGSQMMGTYAVKENADKRFNVAMQAADMDIASMATQTNVGMLMSMLPTAVSDLILPLLTKMAGSKAGGALSGVGMLKGLLGGDKDGIMGDPIGDPGGPIGDQSSYGSYGGTGTGHLAPGLAKAIQAMQRDNPRVKITSGYRDTVTQNRLQKNGVGRVGSASKSQHTRGWAADLGPTSQLDWINKNAHKYGIQTAHNQGEPWHAQLAGTMPVGDPGGPIGDWGDIASGLKTGVNSFLSFGVSDMLQGNLPGSGLAEGAMGVASGITGGLDIFGSIMSLFTGKSGGSTSDKINNAIALFIKTMLGPTMGLAGLMGKNDLDASEVNSIIGKPTKISVDYAKYDGFAPSPYVSGPDIFGDPPVRASLPSMPMPNFTMPSMSSRGGSGSHISVAVTVPIVYQSSGNETIDARRAAATLVPHMEDAVRQVWASAGGR